MAPRRTIRLYRAAGITAAALFTLFVGNIVLVKAGSIAGFTAPRLSTVWEFLILLAATFLGVAFLIGEEGQKTTEEERP